MSKPLLRNGILRLSDLGTGIRIALLLFGALLGALFVFWLGHFVEYENGRDELASYTVRLVDRGAALGDEAAHSMREIEHDGTAPCSEADLAFMRAITVGSEHLADAGRIEDGKLVCSALLGRLASPALVPQPDVESGEWNTWISPWPVIPSTLHGHFLESKGVWVAINGQTLQDHEASASRGVTEYVYDRGRHRMLKSFGPDLPFTAEEIEAGQIIERGGVLYQPMCGKDTIICAVSFESKEHILKVRWPVLLARIAVGAVLGMLLVAVGILLDLRRQSLETQLRKAIRRGELSVAYQPVVDLDTGTIVGAEALARWIKRDGASVPPDLFISMAEERGFVREITWLMIRRVIRELGDILANSQFRVNLNITVQDLVHPDFLPELERLMDAARIPRSNLGVELTERSTADPVIGMEVLPRLKQAGYTLYIDDFGTGYSSLAYLHRLAVDAIKIDQAFTQTVGTNAVTASVVPQILDMARQLDLSIVIEGVETREQAEYFRQAAPGCQAQGWLYGRPVSAADLRMWILPRG